MVRDRARRTLHPEQAAMQDQLGKALGELRESVEATRRLVRERCALPPEEPRGKLTVMKTEKAAAT